MINFIIKEFKSLDKKVFKIVKNGWIFSFTICLISISMLIAYQIFIRSPLLFNCALAIFQASLVYFSMFFVSGIVFNRLLTL